MTENPEPIDDTEPSFDEWEGKIGFSPDAIDEMEETGAEDSPALYQYYRHLTQSKFGLAMLSEFITWTSPNGVIHRSPFTTRTQIALLKLVRSITDKVAFLQNLNGARYRIAELRIDLVVNLLWLEAEKIDTEKPEFLLLVENLKQHAWSIRTMAIGYTDRERILQSKRIIEQRQETVSSQHATEDHSGIKSRLGF